MANESDGWAELEAIQNTPTKQKELGNLSKQYAGLAGLADLNALTEWLATYQAFVFASLVEQYTSIVVLWMPAIPLFLPLQITSQANQRLRTQNDWGF